MLRWCKSKSTMNWMCINIAQWIFFWNVTHCKAILVNAKYYHVLGHAVMVRKIILIIWTLSKVSQSIRIYYFTWKNNITKYHRKNMKSPSVMMLIKSYERYLQLPRGTYFTHVMMSYGTYHQLSQCQWYHLEYITKLHDVNGIIWIISPSDTMSMLSDGTYHQVSQCQLCQMEHITNCHDVNGVIWNISPSVMMSYGICHLVTRCQCCQMEDTNRCHDVNGVRPLAYL